MRRYYETGNLAPRPDVPAKATLVVAAACGAASLFLAGMIWPRILGTVAVGAMSVAVVYLAFSKFRLYLYVVVSYFFFCGFIKKIFCDYVIVYFLRDLLLLILYVSWLGRYPLRRGVRGRYDKLGAASLGAFVLYALAVTFIPFTDELFIFRLGGARWWLAFIPLFFVGADAIDTPRRFDRFCRFFLALAAATGLYGVFQYVFGFDHMYSLSDNFRANVEWGTWYGVDAPAELRARVFSTFDLATTFAAMLRVACLIAVAYFVRTSKTSSRLTLAVLLAVCFAALLLTGTRAAYAPLVIGFAVYTVLEPNRRKAIPVLGALGAGFAAVLILSSQVYLYRITLVVTDYQYTIDRVLRDWKKALTLVGDFPFGLGISTSAKTGKYIDPVMLKAGWKPTYRFIEHGFGQALVSLGWPGLTLFAIMFVAVLIRLGRAMRNDDGEAKWFARLAFVVCFSELFPLFTHASLNFGVGPVTFWLLSGAAISICGRNLGREVRPSSG